jgi:hypothetical protein
MANLSCTHSLKWVQNISGPYFLSIFL